MQSSADSNDTMVLIRQYDIADKIQKLTDQGLLTGDPHSHIIGNINYELMPPGKCASSEYFLYDERRVDEILLSFINDPTYNDSDTE